MTGREFYALTDQDVDRANLAVDPAWAEIPMNGTDPDAFTLTVQSAKQIAELPDPPVEAELLGPLAARGGRTIIVGHTGEGKTTLAHQMLRAITHKELFLEWKGAGGYALVIDLEQGLRSVKRNIHEANLQDTDLVDYILVPDGLALENDLDHQRALDNILQQMGYDIVCLDPYYKAHRSDDPNSEAQIVQLMRILDALRARHGFCLLMPAHPRKPERGVAHPALTIHDIAGSGAISRGAEVVLGIERVNDGYARLRFLKDRDGDLPIGSAWGLLFDREHGYRKDPKDTTPRKAPAIAIANWIVDRGGRATPAEIKAEWEISDATLRARRKALEEHNIVYSRDNNQAVYSHDSSPHSKSAVSPHLQLRTAYSDAETADLQGKVSVSAHPAENGVRTSESAGLQGKRSSPHPALSYGEEPPAVRGTSPDDQGPNDQNGRWDTEPEPDELWQPE